MIYKYKKNPYSTTKYSVQNIPEKVSGLGGGVYQILFLYLHWGGTGVTKYFD